MKRIWSVVLAVIMVVSLLPMAWAEENAESERPDSLPTIAERGYCGGEEDGKNLGLYRNGSKMYDKSGEISCHTCGIGGNHDKIKT